MSNANNLRIVDRSVDVNVDADVDEDVDVDLDENVYVDPQQILHFAYRSIAVDAVAVETIDASKFLFISCNYTFPNSSLILPILRFNLLFLIFVFYFVFLFFLIL